MEAFSVSYRRHVSPSFSFISSSPAPRASTIATTSRFQDLKKKKKEEKNQNKYLLIHSDGIYQEPDICANFRAEAQLISCVVPIH